MTTKNKVETLVARGWGDGLLGIENAKTTKGETLGIMTGILYLAPAGESVEFGGTDTCPHRSTGCGDSCLFFAGRGRFEPVRLPRIAKTVYYVTQRARFLADLRASIAKLARLAKKAGMIPAVRLNGTSDIAWESIAPEIFREFQGLQFYDYTKITARAARFAAGKLPPNYHLTFSRSESNAEDCERVRALGVNVAAVYATPPTGPGVIDGDAHDVRFLDPKGAPGYIVALKAKGDAKKDASGFVIR